MAKYNKQYSGNTVPANELSEDQKTVLQNALATAGQATADVAVLQDSPAAPSGIMVNLDDIRIVGRGRGRSEAVKFIESELSRIPKSKNGEGYFYGNKFANSKGELEPIQPSHRQVLMALHKDGFEFATRKIDGVAGLVVIRLLTDDEIAAKVSERIAKTGNMNGAPHAASK